MSDENRASVAGDAGPFREVARLRRTLAAKPDDAFVGIVPAARQPCARCFRQADHLHHKKRRSQAGSGHPANLIPLCFECHNWVHSNIVAAIDGGYLEHGWSDE